MTRLNDRLRAVCDLDAAFLREYSGLHAEYDGTVVDLSPAGVSANLGRLGGKAVDDPHDEAQLAATENAMRVRFGVVQQHRRDPWTHLEALDLSQYERPYAPEPERMQSRLEHLRLWPELVDNALASLDLVARPVAAMFAGAAKGIADSVAADGEAGERGHAAATRLADRLTAMAQDPEREELYLGERTLTELLGCEDLVDVDLGDLIEYAESERERMQGILQDAMDRLGHGTDVRAGIVALRSEHGDFEDICRQTQAAVDAAAAFVAERGLVPVVEDDCVVEASPPSRSWGVARVSWRAPWEDRGHSFFHITPPDGNWGPGAQKDWLSRFNRSSIPVVAVHEVAPGHCSHARAMARMSSPVRRTLWSELFFEGWAHYAEEMVWQEGYRAEDARYQAGMAIDALLRVARVKCAIGLHTGALTMEEAIALFAEEGHVQGPMARAEAWRGCWEPSYIRYTWGKKLVRELRTRAENHWGPDFSLSRFHTELLSFGSPPLGLVGSAMGLR